MQLFLSNSETKKTQKSQTFLTPFFRELKGYLSHCPVFTSLVGLAIRHKKFQKDAIKIVCVPSTHILIQMKSNCCQALFDLISSFSKYQ